MLKFKFRNSIHSITHRARRVWLIRLDNVGPIWLVSAISSELLESAVSRVRQAQESSTIIENFHKQCGENFPFLFPFYVTPFLFPFYVNVSFLCDHRSTSLSDICHTRCALCGVFGCNTMQLTQNFSQIICFDT